MSSTSSEIGPFGGARPPQRWNALGVDVDPVFPGDPGWPADQDGVAPLPRFPSFDVWFELDDDGVPGYQTIAFAWPATPAQLRLIPWQRILDISVADQLLAAYYGRSVEKVNAMTQEEWHAVVDGSKARARQLRPRRNRVNDDLLDKVAELYLAGSDIETIADHFNVSRRQADRYIARAREEGKLP